MLRNFPTTAEIKFLLNKEMQISWFRCDQQLLTNFTLVSDSVSTCASVMLRRYRDGNIKVCDS